MAEKPANPAESRLRVMVREARPYAAAYSARIIGVLVSVALTIASARLLQPRGRGEFAIATAGVVITVQLLNLGLSSSLLILFSRNRGLITRLLGPLWRYALACGALSGLVGFLLHTALADGASAGIFAWWPLWAAWVPFQLIGLYQASALMSLRDGRSILAIEVSAKLWAAVLGLSALSLFPGDASPFLLALLCSDVWAAGLGARLILRRRLPAGESTEGPAEAFAAALRLGLRAYPLLFLPYLLIKSDLFLLRGLRTAAETGVYSIASTLIDIGLILPTTIAGMGVASVVQARNSADATIRLLRPTLAFLLAASVAVPVAGRPVIRLLFGSGYEDVYPAVLILLPGFVLLGLETVIAQFFAARGYPLFLSWYWGLGVVLNLALNILLIPRYGIFAAAATSSLGYGFVFALIGRRFLRENGLRLSSLFVPPS